MRERRNRNTVSTGSMAVAAARGGFEAPTMVKYDGEEPTYFFNDGGKGTGTRTVSTTGQDGAGRRGCFSVSLMPSSCTGRAPHAALCRPAIGCRIAPPAILLLQMS